MGAFLIALAALVAFSAPSSAQTPAGETLDVYFVDVEGGQATLYVSPSGESMLVDAGYAGVNGRDADRIAAAAALPGSSRSTTSSSRTFTATMPVAFRNWRHCCRSVTLSITERVPRPRSVV